MFVIHEDRVGAVGWPTQRRIPPGYVVDHSSPTAMAGLIPAPVAGQWRRLAITHRTAFIPAVSRLGTEALVETRVISA